MQINPNARNKKLQHLDLILNHQSVLENVLNDFAQGQPYHFRLISRPWNPGGGSTLFQLAVGPKYYFLKVKKTSVTLEGKLECENVFSEKPSLLNEFEMLARAQVAQPHVAAEFHYVEEARFSFLFQEYLQPFHSIISQLNRDQIIGVYHQIESAVRTLFTAGLVHTDIHEHNIRFRGQTPVLVDFEEARVLPQDTPFEESLDVVGRGPLGDVGEMPADRGDLPGPTCLLRLRQVFMQQIHTRFPALPGMATERAAAELHSPISEPDFKPSLDLAAVLEEAGKHYSQNRLADALACLDQALAVAPDAADLLEVKGCLLYQSAEPLQALQTFCRAIRQSPEKAGLYVKLGAAAVAAGKLDLFEGSIARAFQLEPQNREALELLATLNFQEARFEDAARNYYQLVQQDPTNQELLLRLGKCFVEIDHLETAAAVYQQVLDLDPDHELAGHNLQVVRQRLQDAPKEQSIPAPAVQAPKPASTATATSYSFCIITNGRHPKKLQKTIQSIQRLQIPECEILVAGDVPPSLATEVRVIPMPEAAHQGQLGRMRNALVRAAQGAHLIVADDDLLFHPDFYEGLQRFGQDYDVQCVRLLNPDGTRYWDWAMHDPDRGHALVPYGEFDSAIYVTGGLCIMRREVGQRVQWDNERGFYQGEDLDFSSRLHQAAVRIVHNPHCSVTHDDDSYTRVGRVVVRRRSDIGCKWLRNIGPKPLPDQLLELAVQLRETNPAQAADALRLGTRLYPKHADLAANWQQMEEESGGALQDDQWHPFHNPAYTELLQKLAAEDPAANDSITHAHREVHSPVRWLGPVFNPSGYASEGINFLVPIDSRLNLGLLHDNSIYSQRFVDGLPPEERISLSAMADRFHSLKGGIVICHNPASGFKILPDARYHIGRSMFETDRIPHGWAAKCNQMDEVWVPSHFNVETFSRAGVEPSKLVVIPGAVDEQFFDPNRHEPLPLPNPARCNFLSIFEWTLRKGWDVLLAGYLREFSAEDDVCLYLRTYLMCRPDQDPTEALWQMVQDYGAKLQLGSKNWPRIQILPDQVPTQDLPRLYKAVNCLVAPSRGEGWGRPHHEAMTMGIPVIATNWSGTTEFMNDENSYLLDYELVEAKHLEPEILHYQGHQWANPSEDHLRAHLRHVYENPEEARQRGAKARRDVLTRFSRPAVADLIVRRLQEIEERLSTPVLPAVTARQSAPAPSPGAESHPTIRCAWQGSFLDFGSLSHVNRHLSKALQEQPKLHLVRVGRNDLPPSLEHHQDLKRIARTLVPESPANTRVTIRHAWPPDWSRPEHGSLVMMQPWEYGVLPQQWVDRIQNADQIWVYSNYVRHVYINSGVATHKLKLVPLGIDPDRFSPHQDPLPLDTNKSFRFLFVGGTIHRKGPDLLLKAYLETFRAEDDVCLVIKDFGSDSVYAGQTMIEQIQAAQNDPAAPEILYLTNDLPEEDMPRLYTACHCLVHPYRGEGFGLPVLEAMACGLPVIVTGNGATDDFATDEYAYRIPSRRSPVGTKIGSVSLTGIGWLLEPCLASLQKQLQDVFQNPQDAQTKGRRASDYVRQNWTWKHAAQIAHVHLKNLIHAQHERSAALTAKCARQSAPIALPPAAKIGSLNQALAALEANQLENAWTLTLAALAVRPFHPEACLLLARIACAAGDLSVANQAARRAVEIAPGFKPARKFLKTLRRSKNTKGSSWAKLPEPQPPKLTVCLITKNEEKFLDRCLQSVKAVANQIIVVDTGSTDSTLQIARQFGAEIHSQHWQDDFSIPRNKALEHAQGDWVLVLDADEELTDEGRQALAAAMMDASAIAYRLPILDVGEEARGPSYVPRLFRNAPGLFFIGRIHEQVFSSIEVRRQEWGLENRLGDVRILHCGYQKEIVQSRRKTARNLRLLELALEDFPSDANLLMNYGLELMRVGQADLSLKHYLQAFEILTATPSNEVVPELRESILTQLSTHLFSRRNFDDVLHILDSKLAKEHGLTASLHFLKGLCHLERRNFASTVEEMKACLNKRHLPTLTPAHQDILGTSPLHCIANCLSAMEQTDLATASFQQAVDVNPDSRQLRIDYAKHLARASQPIKALEQVHEVCQQNQDDLEGWQLGGELALSNPAFLEFAADWTSEAIKQAPSDRLIRRHRAQVLLLTQDLAGASRLWLQALREGDHRSIAAAIICHACGHGTVSPELVTDEPAVSRALIQWYQHLLAANACKVVEQMNQRLPALEKFAPTAAKMLKAALAEARAAA